MAVAQELPAFALQTSSAQQPTSSTWQAARLRHLQGVTHNLPSQNEVDVLASLLALNARGGCLTYASYRRVTELCQAQLGTKLGLQPSTFLRFACDSRGAVPAQGVLEYILQRSSMRRLRVLAGCHDTYGAGYLDTAQLAAFVAHAVQQLADAEAVQRYLPLGSYASIAAAKVALLLGKGGRVQIRSLVACPLLGQMSEAITDEAAGESESELGSATAGDWFAPSAAARLLDTFEAHAREVGDAEPALSLQQLAACYHGTMTPGFLARVFEELSSSTAGQSRAVDFQSFLRFEAAWQHRAQPPALRTLYPLLCQPGCSCLSQAELRAHIAGVLALWKQAGQTEDLDMGHVAAEVLDMVKPANPEQITCDDLLACGMGGEALGILVDVGAFFLYESRELQQLETM